ALAPLPFHRVRLGAAIVAHIQRIEQVVNGVAEARLIFDEPLQAIEIAPGAILNQRTPELHDLARRARGGLPGQALAHDERDRFLERSIRPVGHLIELAAMEAVVEHGRKILRHARHPALADRLAARLLDRLEHCAGLLAAGHQLAMGRWIMTGELERDRIGMTAYDRRIMPGELARRLRQPDLTAGDAGAFGCESDLEVGLSCNRSQAASHRALERLGRALLDEALAFEI